MFLLRRRICRLFNKSEPHYPMSSLFSHFDDLSFPDITHVRNLQKSFSSITHVRASVMVGAGLSLNAVPNVKGTKPFPLWKELMENIYAELHPLDPAATDKKAEEWSKKVNSLSPLCIAGEYEALYGKKSLDDLIKSLMPEHNFSPGNLHELLLALPWNDVFTTNYDTLLERTEIDHRDYQTVTRIHDLVSTKSPRIIKLHGSFPNSTPYIISEEDYRTYPKKFAPFVNTVRQSLLENDLVMIGFSGEDPNFIQWSGWIRDQLGNDHRSLYLVGCFNLTQSARKFIESRGVTVIDLAPIVKELPFHAKIPAALEWFFRSLMAAKRDSPSLWAKKFLMIENMDSKTRDLVHGNIPILKIHPSASIQKSSSDLKDVNDALNLIRSWKIEREEYPGWIIAPDYIRQRIWNSLEFISKKIITLLEGEGLQARINASREVSWRWSLIMAPFWDEHEKFYTTIIDEYFQLISLNERSELLSKEIAQTIHDLLIALLRDAREMKDDQKWKNFDVKVKSLMDRFQLPNGQYVHEVVQKHLWDFNIDAAIKQISSWLPDENDVLSRMRKAGIQIELDMHAESLPELHDILKKIRLHNLKNFSYENLSMEGWVLLLIDFCKRNSMNMPFQGMDRSIYDRFYELKAYDCSPLQTLEYFNHSIPDNIPVPQCKIEKPGFKPNSYQSTYHLLDLTFEKSLPAFACIRIRDYLGLPMRSGYSEKKLYKAFEITSWYYKFNSIIQLARIITKPENNDLSILQRSEIYLWNQDIIDNAFDSIIPFVKKSLESWRHTFQPGRMEKDRFLSSLEIIYRLTFRLQSERRCILFELATDLFCFCCANKRSEIFYQPCNKLFDILISSSEKELLIKWIPTLAELPYAELKSQLADPILLYLSTKFDFEKDYIKSKNSMLIGKAMDSLLKEINAPTRSNIIQVNSRISVFFLKNLMPEKHKDKFSKKFWSNMKPSLLKNYSYEYILLLPGRKREYERHVKKKILATGIEPSSNGDGTFKMRSDYSVLIQLFYCTRSVFRENQLLLTWSTDEALLLFEKIKKWIFFDYSIFSGKHDNFIFNERLKENLTVAVTNALNTAIIPNLKSISKKELDGLIEWFMDLIKTNNHFLSSAPFFLIHKALLRKKIHDLIHSSFNGNEDDVYVACLSIYNWILLEDRGLIRTKVPSTLLTVLINRFLFRVDVGIRHIIEVLALTIESIPSILKKKEFLIIIDSLSAWNDVLEIKSTNPQKNREFTNHEKMSLQPKMAYLLKALIKWHALNCKEEALPSIMIRMQESYAKSRFPEVRFALTY